MLKSSAITKPFIHWQPGGICVDIDIDEDRLLYLHSVRPAGGPELQPRTRRFSALPLAEVRAAGEGTKFTTSKRQVHSYFSQRLHYVRHEERQQGQEKVLEVVMQDPNGEISVISRFTSYPELPVIRSTVEVENNSAKDITLHVVSSLAFGGLTLTSEAWWKEWHVHFAHNAWFREAQWQERTLPSVGLDDVSVSESSKSNFVISNQGSFSTGGHLPMGALSRVDGKASYLWQIEHNGSWQWEIGDYRDGIYLNAGGPTDQYHQWSKRLSKGESFLTVPVSLVVVQDKFEAVFAPLTEYRRRMRRQHEDNERLPIIFNDYMNCLMGDPDTEKVEALIQPARQAGADFFVIDAGWYSDDAGWWEEVGEWQPSKTRFPAGLNKTLDKIRAAGMVPGLWVETEVVGIHCPTADKLPQDAYFQRNGQRLMEMGRYQLDFRHAAVIERMDAVINRLVNEYGVGYFKFDYNLDITQGTDSNGCSPGDGLLEHNRAYLAWVNRLFDRFPGLVIENCSSGAQRMDYAMLATHPLQSTSDQEDPIMYAAIAAAVPTAVTPEQSATWAYPQPGWDDERNAFTVVNSLLGRIHLSGHLDKLSEHQYKLIVEGMNVYREIRNELRKAIPFWPLGLPLWGADWIALGMDCGKNRYVSVWRCAGEDHCDLQIPVLKDKMINVECLYPTQMPSKAVWNASTGSLSVGLEKAPSARLFRLQVKPYRISASSLLKADSDGIAVS